MAKLNLDYYSGENFYSDGDIENEIMKVAESGIALEDMEYVKFPVLYHMSKVRENILNWYPFKEGASGLEIGCGCGAITGLLCERLESVTAVELSKRRADINFKRHERLENLEIMVGNLNDMVFGKAFDYVILNGVFEYAMGFTEGDTPYETFLENVSRFLKPDGILLIAIENRLGLKYFAGAPEDHTNGYFDGINEYENNDSVRTFSKEEWLELLDTCDMKYRRFYYPYPDYKFPREIFTDATLEQQKYGASTWNFTKYRLALFRENQMAATLRREGVMDRFANSFLIEMSREPFAEEQKVLYAKLNTDRDRHFTIATTIEQQDGKNVVVKRPLSAEAKRHIRHMQEQRQDYGSWKPLAGVAEGDHIVYPFLKEQNLSYQAAKAMKAGDIREVKRLVNKVFHICSEQRNEDKNCKKLLMSEMSGRERKEFQNVFGNTQAGADLECISPANIDLILDNIFEKDGRYVVIDCEWVFDFPVPITFILWRAINELYSTYPVFEKTYAKASLLNDYHISEELSDTFWKWATNFAEEYVGANKLLEYSVPEVGVSLEEFRHRLKEKECMVSQLFLDTGKGFNEEEKIIQETDLEDGYFTLDFDLSAYEHIVSLRFDPLEGSPCVCKIDTEASTGRLTAANASAKASDGDLFLTTDPIYLMKVPGNEKEVHICGKMETLSMDQALEKASQLLQKKQRRTPLWRL